MDKDIDQIISKTFVVDDIDMVKEMLSIVEENLNNNKSQRKNLISALIEKEIK